MNALTLSRGLGRFSIVLGAAELFGGRRMAGRWGWSTAPPCSAFSACGKSWWA